MIDRMAIEPSEKRFDSWICSLVRRHRRVSKVVSSGQNFMLFLNIGSTFFSDLKLFNCEQLTETPKRVLH
jgi:hypothetical protein